MDDDRQLNGDLPTFVPVETILKEDGAPISVSGEKPGSLMMNLETRELFLSTDAASQQFSLSSPDKSNQPKEDETGAGKQWDCNLCSPGLKKALQRERLQVLRQNPSYREMERLRQRSMMQLKRQDPSFRALERERQRARMQLRRQDPSFRAMERERQRRRMRLKRRDPAFREREREQQKSRLMIKRTGEKGPLLAIAAPPPPSGPPGTNTTSPPTTVATSTASVVVVSQPQQQQQQQQQSQQQQQQQQQSQQPHHHHHQPQQHQQAGGKGCVGSQHEAPKREAALYGHLQRIVGYHNLLQVRNPHPEEPGSPFKSPYFTAGELNASSGALVPRRMGTVPQTGSGSHPAGGGHQGAATGTKAHQHQALLARQKGFLDGTVSPCHPLGEVFAASYPTMRDQVLGGGQSCSSLETTPHLQTAASPEGGRPGHSGSGAHLGNSMDLVPSVPDCPECLEAQRQRSECNLCQQQMQSSQHHHQGGGANAGTGRRRSSRQSLERFRCTVCSKEFGMKHHLKEHFKSHGDRNLCCPHCDYRTCYGYALRRHVVIRHDRPAARQAQVVQQLAVQ